VTYADLEKSRTKSRPVSLYFFRYGPEATTYFAYTDALQPVKHTFDLAVGEVEFQPIPIDRGAITASGTLDKTTLDVTTRVDTPLAELFLYYPPSDVVRLTIFQGHVDSPDYRVAWAGRVLSCSRTDNEASFSCEPVDTSLRRPGLRRNYQYGCPHVLYGPACKASRPAATITRTAASVSGPLVAFAPDWETTGKRDKYIGGIAEWVADGGRRERRTIIRFTNSAYDTMVLSGPALGLVAGVAVDLSLGCNHKAELTDDCHALHNNIKNYGGQPWIPTKNPIGIVNNFN
jgi:hypothetical protein